MSLDYTVRPISDRTWLRPPGKRAHSRFDSTWTQTRQLLDRELTHLKARDLVLELDVSERHIRNDGQIRADARPGCPAVVVAFESRHGAQLYRSDQYLDGWSKVGWQENVRAVALTLQALRDMERWGAVDTGQQYAGFKQLGAGTALPASHMTSDEAVHIIRKWARHHGGPYDMTQLLRRARAATHPDRNDGDRAAWDVVEEAAKVLGVVA